MQADEQVAVAAGDPATGAGRDTFGAPAHAGGDPIEGHTSKTVDQSLHALRMHAVEMGGLVIDQVGSSVRALLERDSRLAELVVSREQQVNDYDKRLDRDSLTFIALQQPVANDLRMTRAVARVGLELERVGDEAKKIARFALRLGTASPSDPVVGWRATCATWRTSPRSCCAAPCGRSTRATPRSPQTCLPATSSSIVSTRRPCGSSCPT